MFDNSSEQDLLDDNMISRVNELRKRLSEKEREIFDKVVKDIEDYKTIWKLMKLNIEELDTFFDKPENITPTAQKILDMKNSGDLTQDDIFEIFCGGIIIDDSFSVWEDTNENRLKAIERFRKLLSQQEFEQFLKDLINPEKNYTPEFWKKFLIENKYINENGNYIYKS